MVLTCSPRAAPRSVPWGLLGKSLTGRWQFGVQPLAKNHNLKTKKFTELPKFELVAITNLERFYP